MKRIIKIIVFILIFLFLLHISGKVLMPDWETNTNVKGIYYEKENSIDVIFLGNSDIFSSVSPMEIYKKYGITSFDYAAPSISNMVMYYMLEEVLAYQNPKVVVMDTTSIFSEKDDEISTRKPIDAMKWGKAKNDFLADDIYDFSVYEKLTFVEPFLRYHTRWNELRFSDFKKIFKNYKSTSKGYLIDNKSVPYYGGNSYMKKNKNVIDFPNDYMPLYVLKAKKLCDQKNIKFILTAMPDVSVWNYAKYNKVSSWAKENDIIYIDYNMILKETKINLKTDSRDGGIHLNTNGAIKISNHIADYLHENYELKDHRNDPYYSNWNDDLIIYETQKGDSKNVKVKSSEDR